MFADRGLIGMVTHRYKLGLIFIGLVCISFFQCVDPVQSRNENDIERLSVWQYLKVFSIYQDNVPADAFVFDSASQILRSINDTLRGTHYTTFRKRISVKSLQKSFLPEIVTFKKLTDSCCYIKISEFMSHVTFSQFLSLQDSVKNYKKVVIDLRDNRGGDLVDLDSIVESMLPMGSEYIHVKERVYDKESKKASTQEYNWKTFQNPKPGFANKTYAILMDHLSASASEILIAALKDCANAYLVGDTTYGKGIGQIKLVRRDRDSLQITYLQLAGIRGGKIGEYHRIGIKPDALVNTIGNECIRIAVKYLEPDVNEKLIRYPFLKTFSSGSYIEPAGFIEVFESDPF
jgi:hypothetical protein